MLVAIWIRVNLSSLDSSSVKSNGILQDVPICSPHSNPRFPPESESISLRFCLPDYFLSLHNFNITHLKGSITMAVTTRFCLMCQSEMQCSRGNKLFCSSSCHTKLYRLRTTLNLSNSEMIQKLKAAQLTINQPTTTEDTNQWKTKNTLLTQYRYELERIAVKLLCSQTFKHLSSAGEIHQTLIALKLWCSRYKKRKRLLQSIKSSYFVHKNTSLLNDLSKPIQP